MLNRRLIRIKVFKVLYSVVASGSDSLIEAEKTLSYSCEKTLHLYYFMLNAAVALRNAAQTTVLKSSIRLRRSAIPTGSLSIMRCPHTWPVIPVLSSIARIMA